MPYFSRCFSTSKIFFRNSWASHFQRVMSFCMFTACVSWPLTTSICFFVRSSAFTTLLLRMSRSRSRSSIFLRSTSPSRLIVSSFSMNDFSSCFSVVRRPSTSSFSALSCESFFFRASISFTSLSLLTWCCWISSLFARSCSSRCWFSWTNFSFFASSCSSFSSSFFFSSILLRTLFSRRSSSASASTTSCWTFLRLSSSSARFLSIWPSSSCLISLSTRRSFMCFSSSSFRHFSEWTSSFFFSTADFMSSMSSCDLAKSASILCISSKRPWTILCSMSRFIFTCS
mmetsp:Transcript_23576/g.70159  ORF Transcript_23576/g.70159 Transcript_23576/m.70159 type:complete len:286 (+) Transcript_23576:1200-2057(+)